jgi:hypothetical protein
VSAFAQSARCSWGYDVLFINLQPLDF